MTIAKEILLFTIALLISARIMNWKKKGGKR